MSAQMKWRSFFSSLAFAEKAAAEQCAYIAHEFRQRGQTKWAEIYEGFQQEEVGHFQMVKDLVDGAIETTERAQKVYAGELLSQNASVVERMALVHLAFEPSALAFLGHVYAHADRYFEPEYAERVRHTFGIIVREEVGHITTGKEMIEALLKEETPQVRQEVSKSLRRHKAFLSLGLKTYFGEDPESAEFVQAMRANYEKRYADLTAKVVGM